uniref:Sirohydrochlorin cobaltochelatase n=1 Tax=Candidatus Kentrum sp. DK TaxID=2126562 RepID=A0A450SVN1_9GAMM|nr:MAG: sirohydrochlorin cobaltochelatase [Candidatus Kentron sp. DK]
MKDTILLVGHGSRGPDGNRETEEFAARWRERNPDWDIRLCHIEFADVLLEEGLDEAARDAERVIVAPLIINAAGHVKTEIPAAIAAARRRHPAVAFVYVPHFGACDAIFAILRRYLDRAMRALDMPDPVTTGVILLGRGSSDPMANGEVAKMARWLFEASGHELVDIAFTGITHPRLERVVQRQARLGMTQIVILPYYLFTGRLMERIRNQVAHLERQYPRLRFARGEHFGFEEEIFQLLDKRIRDAGKPEAGMPCDGCVRKLPD